jgi:hypothetical protein
VKIAITPKTGGMIVAGREQNIKARGINRWIAEEPVYA